MTQRQKILNILTIACVSAYSIVSVYFLARRCISEDDSYLKSVTEFGVIFMFACLGIAFLICGVTMNIALKKYFPLFYGSHKCFLWLATISLSVPLFSRAVIDLAYNESKQFEDFYAKEFIVANNLFLIVSTYIPIMTSMSSLIFGYLRKQ